MLQDWATYVCSRQSLNKIRSWGMSQDYTVFQAIDISASKIQVSKGPDGMLSLGWDYGNLAAFDSLALIG